MLLPRHESLNTNTRRPAQQLADTAEQVAYKEMTARGWRWLSRINVGLFYLQSYLCPIRRHLGGSESTSIYYVEIEVNFARVLI
jgi:hypothetical protein